jgi:hypothetical protein
VKLEEALEEKEKQTDRRDGQQQTKKFRKIQSLPPLEPSLTPARAETGNKTQIF